MNRSDFMAIILIIWALVTIIFLVLAFGFSTSFEQFINSIFRIDSLDNFITGFIFFHGPWVIIFIMLLHRALLVFWQNCRQGKPQRLQRVPDQ